MKLSDWRKARNMTQAEFSELVGACLISVSRWERGVRIPDPKFQRAIMDITKGRVRPNDWIVI